jgi:hypothetical protein
MPTYCYRCPNCDSTFEKNTSIREMKRELPCGCGRTLHLDLAAMNPSVGVRESRGRSQAYPYASYAMGVHPKQLPEAREQLARAGVSTDFTPDGDPIITSRAHRRKVMKAVGMHDRNDISG